MTTVDHFLKALAVVESDDDPEAWGDGGQAMGSWQVHPARLCGDMQTYTIIPKLSETWDQLVARVLIATWNKYSNSRTPVQIAMYWHVGHFVRVGDPTWDSKYAVRFTAALLKAQQEMP